MHISDSDGEFLLIEAANVLPRWIKPEIATNRVWIHAGALRIVPRLADRVWEQRAPTIQEALGFLSERGHEMVYSPTIESEAFYRISKYPKGIESQFHHSVVRIPWRVAWLLKRKMGYVSPAIEAFYLRDPVALEPLRKVGGEGLLFKPEGMVDVSVRFTKVGFAQLRSQEFDPPRIWEDVKPLTGPKGAARLETGMKLTCGFEMLLQDPQNQDKPAVREMKILLEDLEEDLDKIPSQEDLDPFSGRDDSEDWMDIDFNDFNTELNGKSNRDPASSHASPAGGGFGDKDAQEQLRKMVSRFESFLNDDRAGIDGAESEESDSDDSEDSEEDEEDESEDEDKEVSFDEDEFARAMREMMGLPPENMATSSGRSVDRIQEIDADQEERNAVEQISRQIENELKETGVLNLDSKASIDDKQKTITNRSQGRTPDGEDGEDDDEDGEINIDFELAKNMLEAFKSQGGASGPAGNLMGILGVNMPPDRDEKR